MNENEEEEVMHKSAIKGVLVSVLGFSALAAHAEELKDKKEFFFLEELAPDVRGAIYEQVVEMLKANPTMIDSLSVLAIDKKGTIYVLDRNKPEVILGRIGEPSCISRDSGL
jgi:hypothetical protein